MRAGVAPAKCQSGLNRVLFHGWNGSLNRQDLIDTFA